MRRSFLLGLTLLLSACAAPLRPPPPMEIVPPAAEIPAELARWSGLWRGRLDRGSEIQLAIERIRTTDLRVLMAMPSGGWSRLSLERDFRRPDEFVFRQVVPIEQPIELHLSAAAHGLIPTLLLEVCFDPGRCTATTRARLERVPY